MFFFSHSLSLINRLPSAICRLVACACLFAGISFQPVYAASDEGFQAGQAHFSAMLAALSGATIPSAEQRGALTRFAKPDPAGSPIPIGAFRTMEFLSTDLKVIPAWTSYAERQQQAADRLLQCLASLNNCATRSEAHWRASLVEISQLDKSQQLNAVNELVNGLITYREDIDNFGRSDYWATPFEAFQAGGDCEDYAIAKYISLRILGFPVEKMRITVIKDTLRNNAHAVLNVNYNQRNLILDNKFNSVVSDRSIRNYKPVYSVNELARWLHLEAKIQLSSN